MEVHMNALLNWLGYWTGIGNEAGHGYAFWSGIGSDLGEVAIIGGLVGIYRQHNCHVDGCARLGRHSVDGTPYIVCRKHHPDIPERVTAEHVAAAHKASQS
jgi:hypothetical protein